MRFCVALFLLVWLGAFLSGRVEAELDGGNGGPTWGYVGFRNSTDQDISIRSISYVTAEGRAVADHSDWKLAAGTSGMLAREDVPAVARSLRYWVTTREGSTLWQADQIVTANDGQQDVPVLNIEFDRVALAEHIRTVQAGGNQKPRQVGRLCIQANTDRPVQLDILCYVDHVGDLHRPIAGAEVQQGEGPVRGMDGRPVSAAICTYSLTTQDGTTTWRATATGDSEFPIVVDQRALISHATRLGVRLPTAAPAPYVVLMPPSGPVNGGSVLNPGPRDPANPWMPRSVPGPQSTGVPRTGYTGQQGGTPSQSLSPKWADRAFGAAVIGGIALGGYNLYKMGKAVGSNPAGAADFANRYRDENPEYRQGPCSRCGGNGKDWFERCPTCGGSGVEKRRVR